MCIAPDMGAGLCGLFSSRNHLVSRGLSGIAPPIRVSESRIPLEAAVVALARCIAATDSDSFPRTIASGFGEDAVASVPEDGGVEPSFASHCLTSVECAMCTVVVSLLPFCSSDCSLGFGTSHPSHAFVPGTQSQVSVDSRSFSYSESGLGEKYADDVDGCDSRESERGGLGRSPNVSRLAFMRLWSGRHVRDP